MNLSNKTNQFSKEDKDMTKLEMVVEIHKPQTKAQINYCINIAKNNEKCMIQEWYNNCKKGVYDSLKFSK